MQTSPPGRAGFAALCFILASAAAALGAEPPPDLTAIGIEAVMDLEVTSVSKRPEKIMDAAAAIYVITREDILRSGVTSIPEALRLAPGVQVARIDSNKWAIGIRGFASRLSRSLLVLIDGRSVYSPLFAGVYWEVQDTLLEDVERIEVIRGPGATLWGANAVNGVINIITRDARQTEGGIARIEGGEEEQRAALRFEGHSGRDFGYRAYAKYFDRDAGFPSGTAEFDDWHMGQVGFRIDGDLGPADSLTVQGDVYDGKSGQRTGVAAYNPPSRTVVEGDADLFGANVLGKWRRRLGPDADLALQFYYDRTHRSEINFEEQRDTLDLELQQGFRPCERHALVWGLGYRMLASDTTMVVPVVEFIPEDRTDDLISAFVQDDVDVVPARLKLILGSKFEHNDYTGFEYQPNVRLSWTPTSRQALWAAVSRALRTPSRLETDINLTDLAEPATPTFYRLLGNTSFKSEELLAYEIGYRVKPTDRLLLDLAVFYDDYDDLASINVGTPVVEASPAPPHVVYPLFYENEMTAKNYGLELAVDWRPTASWRLAGSYSFLDLNLRPNAGSPDTSTEPGVEGASPHHAFVIQSYLDLPHRLELNAVGRVVGKLGTAAAPGYTELDLSLCWHPRTQIELSLIGHNLLHAHHPEFTGGSTGMVEAQRSIQGRLAWRW